MKNKWLVFYTKSRHEKKVSDILNRRGFEVFLPLQKVMRQWTDRKKKVEVPLFNSYIFVAIPEHEITSILEVPGVSWNIKHNGKPAVLHPRELETIKRFIETGLLIEASSELEKFSVGDWVKVTDGPLKGARGLLVDSHNKHFFSMLLESIGQVITVQIDPQIMRRLNEKELTELPEGMKSNPFGKESLFRKL